MKPHPETRELTLLATHPGVTVDEVLAATGWPLQMTDRVVTTAAPTDNELSVLRELHARTEEEHRAGS